MYHKFTIIIAVFFLVFSSCTKDNTITNNYSKFGSITTQLAAKSLSATVGTTVNNSSCDTLGIDGFSDASLDENLLLVRLFTDSNHLWGYFVSRATALASANSKIEIAVDNSKTAVKFVYGSVIDSTGQYLVLNNNTFANIIPYSFFSSETPVSSAWLQQFPNSQDSGYVGYRITNAYGTFYGWLQLSVQVSVNSVTINIPAFARYNVYGRAILAGYTFPAQ